MSDEIAVKKYSRTEAEAATAAFIGRGYEMRHMMLDLFDREAHTALGYGNFEDYALDRLGIEWKPDTVRHLRQWARMEREMCVATHMDPTTVKLTQAEVRQLARLPEGERKAVYDECVTFQAAIVAKSPKGFLSDLEHIVNRRRKELGLPTTGSSMTPAIEAPSAPETGIPATTQVTPNFKPETVKAAAKPVIPTVPVLIVDDEDPNDYDATAILADETLDLSDAIEGETLDVVATDAGLEPVATGKHREVCVQFTADTYARLKPMLDVLRRYMKFPDITEGELIADIVFAHYQIRKERLKRFEV